MELRESRVHEEPKEGAFPKMHRNKSMPKCYVFVGLIGKFGINYRLVLVLEL